METRTFFSDETENYVRKTGKDGNPALEILLRTGRYQAVHADLLSGGMAFSMHWAFDRNDFDFYACVLTEKEARNGWIFRIETAEGLLFLDKLGISGEMREDYVFSAGKDFVPSWAKGAVIYQIFPDRFANGCPENDVQDGEYIYMGKPVKKLDALSDPVEPDDTGCFYGGDLKGIEEKLDYLEDLGVEVIYLNPVFASPSSHRYDCTDFAHVDRHLGDPGEENGDSALIRLAGRIHEKGMKLVLDGVFNHCSCAHYWMDRPEESEVIPTKKSARASSEGAFGNPESPYSRRFRFKNEEQTEYECWWDNLTLPKLNYEGDKSLEKEMLQTAEKWLRPPFSVDGWRLDVAADLGSSLKYNHYFWKEFRRTVKACGPDKLIVAEHYDSPKDWLSGDEWDTVINFEGFCDPVSFFLTGMDKHSDFFSPQLYRNAEAFARTVEEKTAVIPAGSLFAGMNILDNHDHSRFLTRTGHTAGRLSDCGTAAASGNISVPVLRQAVLLQMTFPGAPLVYYGDEAGLCGFTDPDNRRCFPWDDIDEDLHAFYRESIRLHRDSPLLKTGSFRFIYAADNTAAFVRFIGTGQVFTVINTAEEERRVSLPFWIGGRAGYLEEDFVTRTAYSDGEGWTFEKEKYRLSYGLLDITLPPVSAFVFEGE
ncbi:MAG: glycoside hydrolase family 13 protein [Eubacterium sp.]|nr:glycoside hydrolase family 13 protein [Eubacterium sp.]